MPPKIDKSHGFMKSIIKNQVSRDEYDKQQKVAKVEQKEATLTASSPSSSPSSPTSTTSTRAPKRASVALYVPPHVKTKEGEKAESCPSPEPGKRTSSVNTDNQYQKRTRTATPKKEFSSRVLFNFEYTDDAGTLKSFDVQEDDNAEDLAEIFGSRLGLTKPLKNALKYRLNEEIDRCMNAKPS